MSFLFREKFPYYFHKQFSLWPHLDFPLFPLSFLFLLAEYLSKDFGFCRPAAKKNACAILIFLPKRKTNLNIFHITETRKRANNENISFVCVSIRLSLHKYVCMYVCMWWFLASGKSGELLVQRGGKRFQGKLSLVSLQVFLFGVAGGGSWNVTMCAYPF